MKINLLFFISLYLLVSCSFKEQGTSLEEGFKNPPSSFKPKTWMHAMSGNMSKEGMSKDLEALAAAGEGGILFFNIAQGIPYGEIAYNSPEHHDIIKHTAAECERLGLSFGVHNCDGWSSSGGPWIKPEESMKMMVWSETVVDGGDSVNIELAQPTTREGFYRDIAVLAWPSLKSEIADAAVSPKITSSDKNFNIAIATDNRIDSIVPINKTGDKNPWILFDYGTQHTVQSVYMAFSNRDGLADLEISDDGKTFKQAKELKPVRTGKTEWVINEQFDPIAARWFRLNLRQPLQLKEVNLKATRLIDNFVGRTGMAVESNTTLTNLSAPDASMIVEKESVVNLTSSFSVDGRLKTSLPAGKWTVVRFGYTSTGAINWPSSKWGKGLECDKFSRTAFKTHFDAFVQKVIDNVKPVALNALQYIEIDSYEMGGQNWTDNYAETFKEQNGYDILGFLPVYAGRYVESKESTAGVLWDLNNLNCDLMTNNYFRYFTELCHENGLKSYIEPYGFGPVSSLDVTGFTDLPMGEFWMNRNITQVQSPISGAHIYGKNIISAESFTSTAEVNWKGHPAIAKVTGDEAWALGINEFMFHRYTHQANTHVKPGLTMNRWGSHFDRTQTWWMNAGKAWFEYISRGSFLLQQGYPVADVLVFVGDGSHNGDISRKEIKPEIPMGFKYDCTNADVLVNRIQLKNKKMVLPEGNAYSYLILKNIDFISLNSLRRINEIASAGVIIIGEKPTKLAGFLVSEEQKKEFENLVSAIWSKPNVTQDFDFNTVVADFKIVGQDKNFMHRKTGNADIYFFSNTDTVAKSFECIFRVSNKIPELWNAATGETKKLARFKSEGETTRVWISLEAAESAFIVFRESAKGVSSVTEADPVNDYYLDKSNKINVETANEGVLKVVLNNGKKVEISVEPWPSSIDLSSLWNVEFLKENNYAATVPFEILTDWKDNENESIKYYSGTAVYHKSFSLTEKPDENFKAVLDLGEVNIAAEVIVNGKNAGVLWIKPFKTDITDFLVEGENSLEIRVTNQWSNRLIGDERYPKQDGGYKLTGNPPAVDSKMPDWYIKNQPMPAGPRTTFCSGGFYKKDDPLMPSGLLGPVAIRYSNIKSLSTK